MKTRNTVTKRKQKGRLKRKVASLPAVTAPGPAKNNHLDEPATPDRNDVVSTEISGSFKIRREDPDVCGLDDETTLDESDLH